MSSTGVIPWRISRSGIVEVAVFSSHQRCWRSKPPRVILESQTGEFVFFVTSVGACVAKAKERISRSGIVEVAVFYSYQRCWQSKPPRVVLESQTGEFVFFVTSVGACVAKAKERNSSWTRSYHGVVVVSFLLEEAIEC